MRRSTAIMTATAILLVAGCNRGASNNQAAAGNTAGNTAANNVATTNSATAAPSAPSTGGAVDQSFLVGHWAPAGACATLTLSFAADGTASSSDETETRRWRLNGDTLVIEGPGQPPQSMPVARSGDGLVLNTPGGPQTLTRCPAAATAAAGAAPGEADAEAEAETEQ